MKKYIALVLAALVLAGLLFGGYIVYQTKSKIGDAFRYNQNLKTEGYYLAEFEFQMLGVAYLVGHDRYGEAVARLDQIYDGVKTKTGLVKIPTFSNADEKLDFYLERQNPKTGAFYTDDQDHIFTYIGCTSNMIAFIEELSVAAGKPFRLNHRLSFLDDINTPDTLRAFLDDVSRVGWVGSKTKTPFVAITELRDLVEQSERLHLYSFSVEWKQAWYQWFYDNQNTQTGLWGARFRSDGTFVKGGDLVDSEKVIKMFVDRQGNELHADFPLKHRDKIFTSTLERLTTPMPDDLDELHEWILIKDRGIRFLTRYLWQGASPQEKDATKRLIEEFMAVRFEHYFVEADGAFSLYPNAPHADLDGTGEAIGMYAYIGALSPAMQTRLWGDLENSIKDVGTFRVSHLTEGDFETLMKSSEINSLRLYAQDPTGHYREHVECVVYPQGPKSLDVLDLFAKLEKWLETTPQNMGNWVSKENIHRKLSSNIKIKPVCVASEMPLDKANTILQTHPALYVVGFDLLQLPRYKAVFKSLK